MAQILGSPFGNGSDGSVNIASNSRTKYRTSGGVFISTDSSTSGSSGSSTLSVGAGLAFTSGDIILIHQTRGTGVGLWELNQIVSYDGSSITTVIPLSNTYSTSGNNCAQVVYIPQFSSVTMTNNVGTKPWDGITGGIFAFFCSGLTNVTSVISANGAGFRGGAGVTGSFVVGYQGEGSVGGNNVQSNSSNGSGGGGGGYSTNSPWNQGNGGGGGANDTVNGSTGYGSGGGNNAGGGGGGFGSSSGSSDLSLMTFGGGGGGGGTDNNSGKTSGTGGDGGGIILIFSNIFTCTGGVTSTGDYGQEALWQVGSGGSGAGGSIYIRSTQATLGTNLITALGGARVGQAPSHTIGDENGGSGGNGRIRVEACTILGANTQPAYTTYAGISPWCTALGGGII